MERIVRNVSEDGKMVQITIADERWYLKHDDEGNLIKAVPSTTWQASFVPKGIAYFKWLANKGWDEAEAYKNERGGIGYKVHKGIESLLLGNELKMDDELPNHDGNMEPIILDEWECLMSFDQWFKEVKPKPIESELVVFNDEYDYAGTTDLLCEIDGKIVLVDYKISSSIWANYEAQVSAYRKALEGQYDISECGILQLNYKYNKHKKWKYTAVDYDFDLYLAAQKFWHKECANVEVFQKDYPTSLNLSL